MIQLEIVKQCEVRVPRKSLEKFFKFVQKQMGKTSSGQPSRTPKVLVLAFVNSRQSRALNKKFRGKDYPTDVLSFQGLGPESFGELVLCPSVLRRQAMQNGHSFEKELHYMVLHGYLHLLGYEHEGSERKAKAMFRIQDDLFHRFHD